jgi:hypothetical protein
MPKRAAAAHAVADPRQVAALAEPGTTDGALLRRCGGNVGAGV